MKYFGGLWPQGSHAAPCAPCSCSCVQRWWKCGGKSTSMLSFSVMELSPEPHQEKTRQCLTQVSTLLWPPPKCAPLGTPVLWYWVGCLYGCHHPCREQSWRAAQMWSGSNPQCSSLASLKWVPFLSVITALWENSRSVRKNIGECSLNDGKKPKMGVHGKFNQS